MGMSLTQVREALAAKRQQGHDLIANGIESMTEEQVTSFQAITAECDELGKQERGLVELQAAADDNAADMERLTKARPPVPLPGSPVANDTRDGAMLVKTSIGDAFVKAYGLDKPQGDDGRKYHGAENERGPVIEFDRAKINLGVMERKTIVDLTSSFAVQNIRDAGILPFLTQKNFIRNLLPSSPTIQNGVAYMEETTFTNNASEANESGTYGESVLAFTEKTSKVIKIAVSIPITDEAIADVQGLASYINTRVMLMLANREDLQLLTGSGGVGPPQLLRGINNFTGIQTQAKGADPTPDSIYKAMILCQTVGFVWPDNLIVNGLDWQDIKLLRTADGLYIFGSPNEPGPETMWGLPVTITNNQTQNTGLIGNFAIGAEIRQRSEIALQMSNEHSTFFVEGKHMIRAEMREALVAYRPKAFCTITGI